MNYCPHCGATNRSGAKFCARCGRSITAVSIPPLTPPPLASHRNRNTLLFGGGLIFFVLLIIAGWGIWGREPAAPGVTVEAAGSVVVVPPTFTPTPPRNASPTPANAPVGDAEANPTPTPGPTPTRGPLKIPGTDIEVPRITDGEEIQIGREIAAEVEAEFSVYHNAAQLARVGDIGRAIIPYTDRPQMPYTFTLLDTSEVNAFAVPGGFIYVTRGMLDFVHDDDELAAVIGHELAHVARRHGAEQLEALAVAEAGARWLLDREPQLEDIYDTEEGAMATEMTAVLLLNGWSRQNEYEADEYGTLYSAKAGYDPHAAIRLFNRMERAFVEGEKDEFTRLFDTHPPFPDRVQRIEEVLQENGL